MRLQPAAYLLLHMIKRSRVLDRRRAIRGTLQLAIGINHPLGCTVCIVIMPSHQLVSHRGIPVKHQSSAREGSEQVSMTYTISCMVQYLRDADPIRGSRPGARCPWDGDMYLHELLPVLWAV